MGVVRVGYGTTHLTETGWQRSLVSQAVAGVSVMTSATHGHVGKHWLMQEDKLFVIAADTLIGLLKF